MGNIQAYPPGAMEPKCNSTASPKLPSIRTNFIGIFRLVSFQKVLLNGSLCPPAPTIILALNSLPSLNLIIFSSIESTRELTRYLAPFDFAKSTRASS